MVARSHSSGLVRKRIGGTRGWLALALALLLSVAVAPTAHAASESEPNGSLSQATPLTFGAPISGCSCTADGWGTDHDYYRVDLAQSGRLKLTLSFPNNLGTDSAYDVEIFNAAGTSLYGFGLSAADWKGTALVDKGIYLPAGRAYVEVSGDDDWTTWGRTYELTAALETGVVEHEVNSGTNTATPLTLGQPVSGSALNADNWGTDHDYYRVDLPSAGRLQLNLTYPNNLGTGQAYDVSVLNAAGDTLYSTGVQASDWKGSSLANLAMYVPAGRTYIHISGEDDWATWGVSYKLLTTLYPGTVEQEVNDATSNATPLVLGKSVLGSTLNEDDWGSDHDYYRFDSPQADQFAINLTFPAGLGTGSGYEIHVFNTQGNEISETDVGASMSSFTTTLPLSAGRAYVLVYGEDEWATWGKTYQLTVSRAWSAAPAPSIAGSAHVRAVLTANTGTWSPAPSTVSYQWYRSGQSIAGATGRTFRLTSAELGKQIQVKVTASRPDYSSAQRWSAKTAVVTLPPVSSSVPVVLGTARVGLKLVAQPGAWGPAPVQLSYQWYRGGSRIAGATQSSYTLVAADRGQRVMVKVTGTKSGLSSVTRSSAQTGSVAAGILSKVSTPRITGVLKVRFTLQATVVPWSPSGVRYSYQWYRSGVRISGATKSSYRLGAADKGRKMSVKVTGSKAGYTSVAKSSAKTGVVRS